MRVRIAEKYEREAAIARLIGIWGDPIRVRSQAYAIGDCSIFVAGEMAGLAAVSMRDRPVAELVAINAFTQYRGIGTALLQAIIGALDGFDTLRLTTTNDNIDALRFYQRRDFRLAELRPGAVDEARRHKPSISAIGRYAIPLRDELELHLAL